MHSVPDELVTAVSTGSAVLFTGAGFSCDARDLDGQPLPDGRAMIAELWPLCFDGDPDDSTLPDLYDAALICAPDRLHAYTQRRLRIGDAPLPEHLARWFAAPWRRIYTLNVDDLEVAIQRQYRLPHRLRPVSALLDEPPPASAIDVVHLNGFVGTDARELTFSTMQYASRLSNGDREYARLAEDLHASPFVFAGTTLDEAVLWQHVEMRRKHAPPRRPRSFLVTKSLSRARQTLLENLGIVWVQAEIDEVASRLPRDAARSS
jgi:hypothetical protein